MHIDLDNGIKDSVIVYYKFSIFVANDQIQDDPWSALAPRFNIEL